MIDFIPVSLLLAALIWALIGIDRADTAKTRRKDQGALDAATKSLNNFKKRGFK